jgi:hypothetical protein
MINSIIGAGRGYMMDAKDKRREPRKPLLRRKKCVDIDTVTLGNNYPIYKVYTNGQKN